MGKSSSTAINILKNAMKLGIDATKASEKAGYSPAYISSVFRHFEERKKKGSISKEEYNSFMNIYDDYIKSGYAGANAVRHLERKTKSAAENYAVRQTNPLNLKMDEVSELEYNAETDDAYDDRSKGEILRGKESFTDRHGMKMKRITGYKYRILIRGENPLEGSFAREQRILATV